MFKTKYRIKKSIKEWGTVYDGQYKLWYWPFWSDITMFIYRKSIEEAELDIKKHQFKEEIEIFKY